MKKVTLSILSTVVFSFANTITIDGFSFPESTIINGNHLYVSNVGKELKPTQKDGDGFISKLSKNGVIENLHFIDGLDAPKGLGIVNNTLFVADVDTLKGFDLTSKKEVLSLVFKDTKFLNDITIKDENTILVGSSDLSAVYEVDIVNKKYKKIVDLTTANGLFYEDGILYSAELGSSAETMFDAKGRFFQIDLKNSNKKTQLGTFQGILDGVYKFKDKVYVSDWVDFKKSGIIRVYDLITKKQSTLNLEPFMGSADFWIDEKTSKLYLPQMLGGKISIIDLNSL